MLDRFRRSIVLVKASYAVLRSDKELLVFPLVSFAAMVVATIGFFVPFLLSGALTRTAEGTVDPVAVVLGFLYYVVAYTVIFFFNTALVGAAMIRLDGGDPKLSDGFRIARSHLPAIIGYAIIAATVGMILRAIAERGGIVGQLVMGFVGLAWNVATFLVVPVLVMENVGPTQAIKRSSSLLKRTWGEQIVGNVGISLIFGLLVVGTVVPGGLLIVGLATFSTALAIVAGIALILVVAAIALVGAALSGIFTASVYRYATKGDGGDMFRPETLSAAFQSRHAR
ncbi:DUF6159 family protein [soil metagenome]